MAITKIIKVKANPKACIKYVTNPNKTNDKLLVSCVGCTEQNAPGVFNLALMGNGQKALDEQVVKAYHFIQSFAPTDEVTPEDAHKIGLHKFDSLPEQPDIFHLSLLHQTFLVK